MAELILPQTIDAGTPMSAAEVQANFVATRDVINGNIEGGTGASSNMKANGVTARELDDSLMQALGQGSGQEVEGIVNTAATGAALAVTPGAGLTVNIAAGKAFVRDTTGILTSGIIPVTYAGGSVAAAANASGNPRIDQVILTVTGWNIGTVSILQGTPTAAATLANRSGAAALPSNAIRLADLQINNGFGGPFVVNTNLRDRRLFTNHASARLQWTGSAAMLTNTHYAFSAFGGMTDIGVDPGLLFDHTNGRMTREATAARLIAPQTGVYHFYAYAAWTPSATAGARGINIRRNTNGASGTPTAGGTAGVAAQTGFGGSGSNQTILSTGGYFPLWADDELEITVYQNIGVNLNLVAVQLAMTLVEPGGVGE
jgi:hypothetical protein